MKKRLVVLLLVTVPVLASAQDGTPRPARRPAPAAQRDLVVELRQVDDVQGGGYVVGTQPRAAAMAPQQVRVRNGQQASLAVGQTMQMQWVESAAAQSGSLTAPGVRARRQSGAGVGLGMATLQAGQRLVVKPQWPGGAQPAVVDVQVQAENVEERTGTDLPAQSRSQLATRVSAPLGEWVTLAASGSAPQKGVYGTGAASAPRRLLQLRVSTP